jgi:hypothetical protein
MKRTFLAATVAALFLAGCSGDPSETSQREATPIENTAAAPVADESAATDAASVPAAAMDQAALTAEAKQAVMALGSTLKTQLQAAIQSGGPASAVDVCHKIAPATAASLSDEHGLTLTRVSLRNRNPEMGVPNDWQTVVLQDFEARKAAGEGADRLAYSEVVDGEYRFMKAIPTEAVCLNCHGADIKPDVQAKIDALYPEDRAVGFSEGDLRGAFVAVRKLAE